MNPIRPAGLPITPAPPQTGGSAEVARAAAQRAFFDAAMGRTPAPAATQAAAPVQRAVQTAAATIPQRVEIRPGTPDETPTRILRPGSFLDIRI